MRILIIEDNQSDVEMIKRVLAKGDIAHEFRVVSTRDQYLSALDAQQPDIIISDNTLPGFNATEALEIYHERALYIPFILVTGTVSEDFAVNIIKLGADDYILKDRLTRLPSAIEGALRQRKAEYERKLAIDHLVQSQENLMAIFENTSEGFVLTDANGIVRAFNEEGRRFGLMNTDKELITGHHIEEFISPDRLPVLRDVLKRAMAGEKVEYDRSYETQDGTRWMLITITPVYKYGVVNGICIAGKDITERKQKLEKELDEQRRISSAVLQAQERERAYMGQELHDNINQLLVACKIYASQAVSKCPLAERELNKAIELIDNTITEIRALCHSIVTPPKDMNLRQQLHLLIETVRNSGIEAGFTFAEMKELDYELRLGLYRLAQEQLNNIMRHSGATKIHVEVRASDTELVLQITDNGRGFDPQALRKGVGITSMLNRVESFSGTLVFDSSPGNGCRTIVSIPLTEHSS